MVYGHLELGFISKGYICSFSVWNIYILIHIKGLLTSYYISMMFSIDDKNNCSYSYFPNHYHTSYNSKFDYWSLEVFMHPVNSDLYQSLLSCSFNLTLQYALNLYKIYIPEDQVQQNRILRIYRIVLKTGICLNLNFQLYFPYYVLA